MAVVAIAAAVVTLAQSVSHYSGRRGDLGAGTFPTWIAGFLLIVAVFLLHDATKFTAASAAIERPAIRRILILLISVFAYLAVMPRIGFGIATALFLLLQFRVLGDHSIPVTLACAVGLAGAVTYLFVILLPMGLPIGPWGI